MKYIKTGYAVDVQDYMAYLKIVSDRLPSSVKEYVNDERHWDWNTEYCPHDYYLTKLMLSQTHDSRLQVEITFDSGVNLHKYLYTDVVAYNVNNLTNLGVKFRTLGTQMIIDEIILNEEDPNIIVHEFALDNGGVILITTKSFRHEWKNK